MNPFRGVMMIAAAGIAFYLGWRRFTGSEALLAFGLGVVAVGLAVWHLTRSTEGRRWRRM
jgi:hypothetical protein